MGKTEPMEKFGKLNQQKICISSFRSVNGNRISASAIMKKLKNGCHFVKIDCTEKFQITDPPPPQNSLDLQLSQCQWKWNISISHYEKIEKWLPLHKY